MSRAVALAAAIAALLSASGAVGALPNAEINSTTPTPTPASTATPSGAALSIAVPAGIQWKPGVAVPISVSVKNGAAPAISLSDGPFYNAATNQSLLTDFCFAAAKSNNHLSCLDGLSLAQNETRRLYLLDRGGPGGETGAFSGPIRLLASNGLEAVQTVTVSYSPPGWRLLGLVALVLGVLLSFYLSILWPYRRNRDRSLIPFYQLEARLAVAKRQRGKLECEDIDALSRRLSEEVSKKWLVNNRKIGGAWPSAAGDGTSPDDLKAYLDSMTPLVIAIERLSRAAAAHPDRAEQINAIARQDPFPPVDMDGALQTALGNPPAAALRVGFPDPARSIAVIAERENIQNLAYWAFSSLVAVALGYATLVNGHPGYGGLNDLLTAFLWGLGVSTVGSKLADLTTTSVRTALRPATP